jgi:hypothetical protein
MTLTKDEFVEKCLKYRTKKRREKQRLLDDILSRSMRRAKAIKIQSKLKGD